MNYLTLPFFKALLKKKESKIALAFSIFPMLLIVVSLFNTTFMQLSAPVGSLSFLEFFGAVLSTQYQMTLPLIVFIYISSTIFRDEITSGIMYLYKDIRKQVILNAKIGSIFLLQMLYITITFFTSLFTYYVYLVNEPYTSGKFFPTKNEDLQYALVGIFGIVFIFLLCSMVANLASIILTNGFTMLVGIIFALVSFIAPSLPSLRYLFPNGYVNVLEGLSFNRSVLLLILIFVIYYTVLYIISLRLYNRLEY